VSLLLDDGRATTREDSFEVLTFSRRQQNSRGGVDRVVGEQGSRGNPSSAFRDGCDPAAGP
jgi:hypothetical protein